MMLAKKKKKSHTQKTQTSSQKTPFHGISVSSKAVGMSRIIHNVRRKTYLEERFWTYMEEEGEIVIVEK